MPNQCSNILRVRGRPKLLFVFQGAAVGPGPRWNGKIAYEKPLDINQFIPVPDKVLHARKNNKSNAFNSGGIEWVNENHGTKWGCYDCQVSRPSKGELRYDFYTAWSPFSENVLRSMSLRFASLEFELKYAEAGMGLAGTMSAVSGAVSGTEYINMDASAIKDKEIKAMLGYKE